MRRGGRSRPGRMVGLVVKGIATVVLLLAALPPLRVAAQPVTSSQPKAATTAAAATLAPMDDFLSALRAEALAKGIAATTFDAATAGLTPDPEVIALSGVQLEHERTIWDYLALLVTEERIATGRQKLAELATPLAAIERRFGVDRHIVVAVWGVETLYGAKRGDRNVVRSLATLAMADQRRGAFWRGELLAALRILQRGDIDLARMTGSWAGAMGHTQFMPTTYLAHAADLDADGRRDIWGNVGDALASTASYLDASGWITGAPWGFEVMLPVGFDFGLSAPGVNKRLAEWQALGLARPPGEAWPGTLTDLRLVLPAGAKGPAFLVSANFRALLRYNASVAYALAVAQLADRIAGRAGISATWPTGERALSRAEREELQGLLTRLGHDTGGVDGIVGSGTRGAIRAYQRARAIPEDGFPSVELLERLRHERRS